jgi:hypothetical protein
LLRKNDKSKRETTGEPEQHGAQHVDIEDERECNPRIKNREKGQILNADRQRQGAEHAADCAERRARSIETREACAENKDEQYDLRRVVIDTTSAEISANMRRTTRILDGAYCLGLGAACHA